MEQKVIVVDDEALILATVRKALSRVGYEVTTAQSIEELGTALENAPFDLLITDVYMEGTTVDDIIERVRASSPDLKVMRMSGAVEEKNSLTFMEKPFRIDDLRDRVKRILDGPDKH